LRWANLPFSLLTYLPSAALFVFCSWRILKALDPARAGLATGALLLCAAAPLALNVIGSDLDRWNVFVLFDSFAALLIVARPSFAAGVDLPKPTPTWVHAAVFLVVTNLASGGGLFGNQTIAPYPFRTHVETIYNALHGHPPGRPDI
jgi:peptidoglycan/LPS O-acetylase OafA/YrhL